MLVTVEAPASFLVWRNGMTNFQWVITIGASLTVLYLRPCLCMVSFKGARSKKKDQRI